MKRTVDVPASGLMTGRSWIWWSVAVIAITVIVWFVSGPAGGMLQGRAGFSDVKGSWHLDAVGYEAMVAAKETYLAGLPGGGVNAKLTAAKLRSIAAPYANLSYSFSSKAYTVQGQDGSNAHETACTYVGESPVLLHVIGEQDGVMDDLTFIIDPKLGMIFLRLEDGALPFVRE